MLWEGGLSLGGRLWSCSFVRSSVRGLSIGCQRTRRTLVWYGMVSGLMRTSSYSVSVQFVLNQPATNFSVRGIMCSGYCVPVCCVLLKGTGMGCIISEPLSPRRSTLTNTSPTAASHSSVQSAQQHTQTVS